jgi:hypothetical protein
VKPLSLGYSIAGNPSGIAVSFVVTVVDVMTASLLQPISKKVVINAIANVKRTI